MKRRTALNSLFFYLDRRELFARKERCSAESVEFEVSGGTAANLRPDIRLTGDPEGMGLHLQSPRSAPPSEMRFFAGTSINGKILPEVQLIFKKNRNMRHLRLDLEVLKK